MAYCPKCQSRLFPDDEKYMEKIGVCGYCYSFDTSPGKRLQVAYAEAVKKEESNKSKKRRWRKTF